MFYGLHQQSKYFGFLASVFCSNVVYLVNEVYCKSLLCLQPLYVYQRLFLFMFQKTNGDYWDDLLSATVLHFSVNASLLSEWTLFCCHYMYVNSSCSVTPFNNFALISSADSSCQQMRKVYRKLLVFVKLLYTCKESIFTRCYIFIFMVIFNLLLISTAKCHLGKLRLTFIAS